MKSFLSLLLLVVGSTNAFAPMNNNNNCNAAVPTSKTELHASRRDLLRSTTAATTAALLLPLQLQQPAWAAKYGDFGSAGSAVLDPTSTDVDASILGSSKVQSALSDIRQFRSQITQLTNTLTQDSQANLSAALRQIDIAKLRQNLNTPNEALDEDAQRGTDRLIRVILQDLTELEIANAQKPGVPRSDRRLATLQSKLAKLETAVDAYLAFFQ